jgi:hypothetical protein
MDCISTLVHTHSGNEAIFSKTGRGQGAGGGSGDKEKE